jgi:anti-anti-sigma factor
VSLSIVRRTLPDGVVEIAPRGEIDVDTAHEVREAVAAVLARPQARPTRIHLNMRLVNFVDSVGISALVGGFQTAEVSGVKLVITEPSRLVHRQLWVTGLLGLFGAPQPPRAERVEAPQPPRVERVEAPRPPRVERVEAPQAPRVERVEARPLPGPTG